MTLNLPPNFRLSALAVGVPAFLTIGGAWVFQFAGYPPCDLCYLQRYAYYAGVPLAAALAGCALCGTAVGPNALKYTQPTIARALELRRERGLTPLDIGPFAPLDGEVFRVHQGRQLAAGPGGGRPAEFPREGLVHRDNLAGDIVHTGQVGAVLPRGDEIAVDDRRGQGRDGGRIGL